MTQLSSDNILVYAEDEKKAKKGDGLKAILGLMIELRDFQDKVKNTIDAQDLGEIKSKIEAFDGPIMQMWKTLNAISQSGIKSIREMENPAVAPQNPTEEASKGISGEKSAAPQAPHSPVMAEHVIQKLP